jgi:hypothetical protein
MTFKPSVFNLNTDQLSIKSLLYFFVELENLFDYIGKHLLLANETIQSLKVLLQDFYSFHFPHESCF